MKIQYNGWLHFVDKSFAETIAESKIRTETKDQRKMKSFFVCTQQSLSPKFGLRKCSAICWDQTLDSAIAETKVNPNLLSYALLVLHGRDTLIL